MQKWKKLGRIFNVSGKYSWMKTHAANPTPIILDEKIVRVFFSSRDKLNRSFINYVDIDLEKIEIINQSDNPVVSLGASEEFDKDGCSMGCVVENDGISRLYYLGWNVGINSTFHNSIGFVEKKSDSKEYKKSYSGAVLGESLVNPFSLSYPFILIENGKWKMWYGSHKTCGRTVNEIIHVLKYAESDNGIDWELSDGICIDSDNVDYAFSRPCVIKENGLYKMWYCYKRNQYRIGYAESDDGIDWIRKDSEVGITTSDEGWDSEMICYPFVFDFRNNRYMLYNGNQYGKTGFGIAILLDNKFSSKR